ncbi:hypothetical protein PFI31113_04989 [Pandoraea fibrosis]|uniref:Uncharacterized protein n=1 Tax=Pandoraea fibrosis TaxID=1891094 RepID=A0A5E4Z4D5_9BURK|nr:hypothetical protein PFI31113_04989 [Pandoraea fibrosis]
MGLIGMRLMRHGRLVNFLLLGEGRSQRQSRSIAGARRMAVPTTWVVESQTSFIVGTKRVFRSSGLKLLRLKLEILKGLMLLITFSKMASG